MGKSLWVERGQPYGSDLNEPYEKVPIKMMRFEWIEVNRGEWSEMKWNEWFEGSELEQPYGNGPMVDRRWTLWKWLDVSENQCPYQFEWNRWEMNELSE